MRIAKWTSIIVGGILLVLLTAAFVMTYLVDPNRYRGKIEAIVGDLAGRPFVVEGNLEITWFPWLGVRMGPAHFSDNVRIGGPGGIAGPDGIRGPGGFAEPGVPRHGIAEPIAEWQSIAIAAKVLPLLQGQLVVDRIRLQSPHIRLRRDAQGHANWEDLGSRKSSSPGRPTPPEIAGLEIRDGMLDYVDEKSGLQVSLSRLELDMGEWRAGETLPVHARFLLHTRSTPPPGVWVQLDAPELGIRLDPLNIAAPQLAIRVADAQIKGDLHYERSADAHTRARGTLAIHAPSLRKLANDLGLNQTLPHDPTTLGPLELTGNWSYTDGALAARPVAAKLDGVNFLGWVERTAAPQSAWSFELRGDRIDLGRYVNVDSTRSKPFELPLDTLRAINANGILIFDQAQIADANITDLRLRFETAEAKQ